MKSLNVSEARKNLPRLASEVNETREPLVITRRGRPLAILMPYSESEEKKESDIYPLRGTSIDMSPDFDDSLDEMWEALTS